jgi:LDH2 family malate/lactate/ureidoglycolate dehydrogenase
MACSTLGAKLFVGAADAQAFIEGVLIGNGVATENATVVARCLVATDLRGVDTHGMNRIPSYMERIRQGVLDARATPNVKQVTPAVAHIDANNGFGFLAADAGMAAAIESAKIYGIGMASITHSNNYGMSAWIVQKALDANMMSLVFTNSSPALPAWGGRSKLLGVSPLACGAPGKENPFILDMAPSIAARGKIYKAKRRGEKIPLDWALDRDGKPTADPAAALDGGVMLPMGGPKGSGLAVMMDVFSGVLSGSAFAGEVTGPYDPSNPSNVGHFLVAIQPDLFMSLDDFKERMQYLFDKVVGAEKAAGVDRIYFPGEIEQLQQQEREKTGIPLVKAEVDALNAEATKVGAKPLVVKI